MAPENTASVDTSNGAVAGASDTRFEPPYVSYSVLAVGGSGFLLWAIGWFVLIPDHFSHLGWILEVLGPLLIAAAMIMCVERLVLRIGKWAVALGVLGSIAFGVSTLPFGIQPANLESNGYVSLGYALYGVGLTLGCGALLLVIARKESELESAVAHSRPQCPAGCMCPEVIHSSFASITIGAIGLLVWGIGFLGLSADPSGSRFNWLLAVAGSLLVTLALTMHFKHLVRRFGRAAIIIGIASAFIWSLGYLIEEITPNALPTSGSYGYLFLCYGVGHLLTAVTLVLVARKKYVLEH